MIVAIESEETVSSPSINHMYNPFATLIPAFLAELRPPFGLFTIFIEAYWEAI